MTTQPEHRLLAVFAHPDDETIGAGGLLALAARAGVDVSVVTCTRGERGEVIPPDLAHLAEDPEQLALRREAELSAALAELGVHRHLFLDQVPALEGQRPTRFADSGMRWVRPGLAGPSADASGDAFTALDVDVAAHLLAVVVRHVRPTAVLTEEPGGGYGHPDHVHAHRVTSRAVEIAADAAEPLGGLAPWQVPTVLWVAQEESHLRAALAELADVTGRHEPRHAPDGTVLSVPDPGGELSSLAAPAAAITASFDVRPVAEQVLAALRHHSTQVQAVAPIDGRALVGQLALSNAALVPVLDRVHLRAAPGSDASALAAVLADDDGVTRVPAPVAPAPVLSGEQADPAGPSPVPAATGGAAEPAPRRGVLGRLVTTGGTVGVLVSLLAGLVMGALGTVVHRFTLEDLPVGIVLGLAGVLAAAVAARAIAGGGGLLLAALAVVGTTQAMAFLRPGGDVLVTNEAISYAWLFGAPIACVTAALLPARWFGDHSRRRRT
ncbi:N-acetylglucosaminyl deacetylase, LmbE family [Georgenia satyanarayanai]|uniref:N-acetylglucosaminyl deacetylase, LmbE family n=1 Tax=Georgenia satyanarayanai TaxID=860221 RepID=A0A2Y9AV71_9MICO|nr:PIG-L family deacetylase [Georgenia satyanarayanai]PYF96811.1 LmbE family N-acetylglucosaminyl deacetylase [Georgenia satyanarayanai]SSA46407.1 N-acetylglucosaminyl deacetylase, LmbE family [Georgenia satyanarayanai]